MHSIHKTGGTYFQLFVFKILRDNGLTLCNENDRFQVDFMFGDGYIVASRRKERFFFKEYIIIVGRK